MRVSTDVLLACATLVPASRAGDPLPFEERVWKGRRAVRKPLIIPSESQPKQKALSLENLIKELLATAQAGFKKTSRA